MQSDRLKYIDALRGIAVLMVIMVHSTELSQIQDFKSMIKNFIDSGIFGVQLFFIISAFTLFFTFKNHNKSASAFYLRRFFRIAPAYYIAILFYSWYYKTWGLGELTNFTFLHSFFPKYINSIVPGGWTIGIEMFFYLFVPLLFKFINTLAKALYFLIFTLLFKVLAFYIIKLPNLSYIEIDGSFVYFWFPNQLPIFALGFILYFYLMAETKPSKEFYLGILLIAILIIFSIMTGLPVFSNHFIIAAAFTIAIASLKKSMLHLYLEQRLLLLIGKISYSAYLCQYAIIFLILELGVNNPCPQSFAGFRYINFIFNFIILALITNVTAYVMFNLIEKPFQKIGARIANKF